MLCNNTYNIDEDRIPLKFLEKVHLKSMYPLQRGNYFSIFFKMKYCIRALCNENGLGNPMSVQNMVLLIEKYIEQNSFTHSKERMVSIAFE